ncbi:MAG TPA: hypothetical protein VN193_08575 [Candidatus Angelobacter sp.]|nr:hypothetical protein [Candidatus Angelobacter sp.]
MSTRKMVASGVVAALALGVGLWRANSGAGTHSVLVGSLRVVTADAQTTGSVITEQQALSTILSKITQMEPGVAWPTSAAPQTAPGISLPGGWSMEEVSGVTQVYDNVTGKLLYRRTWPISAWVAQYHSALGTYGFGMVSDGANLPTCFNERTCEPPGQLLVAQAFVEPGGLTPQCTAPASNPQQYIQCETK